MRLVVFKDLDTKYRYSDKIIDNLPFNRSSQTVGKTVKMITVDTFDSSSLRGYTFTDVLFVGYENQLEVVGKCPIDIQAAIMGIPSEKRHYCKPAEPNFDKALTTNSLRFSKNYVLNLPDGCSIDEKAIKGVDEWKREYFASGARND